MAFEFTLVAPADLTATTDATSDVPNDDMDYNALIMESCAYPENAGYRFHVPGFGDDS